MSTLTQYSTFTTAFPSYQAPTPTTTFTTSTSTSETTKVDQTTSSTSTSETTQVGQTTSSTSTSETTKVDQTTSITSESTSQTSTSTAPISYTTTLINDWVTVGTSLCSEVTDFTLFTSTVGSTVFQGASITVGTPLLKCSAITTSITTTISLDACGQDNTATATTVTTIDNTVYTTFNYRVHIHEKQCTFDFEGVYLAKHNELRASMKDTNPVTWNTGLAAVAQGYADDFACTPDLIHSGNNYNGTPIGENLAKGYALEDASGVQAWWNEESLYDYNNPGFSAATGHFTQLVWAATTEIGCGYKDCSGSVYLVCNYMPIGNVIVVNNVNKYIQFVENVKPLKD